MLRVQFNGNVTRQNVEFSRVSNNVVRLTGEKIPRKTEGFMMYLLNGDFLGDYSDYTVIVADNGDSVQFGRPE